MEIEYNAETRESTHLPLVAYSPQAKMKQDLTILSRLADPIWRSVCLEITDKNKSEEQALNELVQKLSFQCNVVFGIGEYQFFCRYEKTRLGYIFAITLTKDGISATRSFGILNYPLGEVISFKQMKSVRWQVRPVYHRGVRQENEILFFRQNDGTCLTFIDWAGQSEENEKTFQRLAKLVSEKNISSIEFIAHENLTTSQIVNEFIRIAENKG